MQRSGLDSHRGAFQLCPRTSRPARNHFGCDLELTRDPRTLQPNRSRSPVVPTMPVSGPPRRIDGEEGCYRQKSPYRLLYVSFAVWSRFPLASARALAASATFRSVPSLLLRVVLADTDSTSSRQFSCDSSETLWRSFSGDGTSEYVAPQAAEMSSHLGPRQLPVQPEHNSTPQSQGSANPSQVPLQRGSRAALRW
jgi:hypothetical protein